MNAVSGGGACFVESRTYKTVPLSVNACGSGVTGQPDASTPLLNSSAHRRVATLMKSPFFAKYCPMQILIK